MDTPPIIIDFHQPRLIRRPVEKGESEASLVIISIFWVETDNIRQPWIALFRVYICPREDFFLRRKQ